MSVFSRLRDAAEARRVKAAKAITQEFRNQLFASPICSDYENVFAQVRPLVDEMVSVIPFGVGRNGARKDLNATPELALLYDPNETFGGIEFLDTMFATWLTEKYLYIHVHKKKNGNIDGYTLLTCDTHVNDGFGHEYWLVENDEGGVDRLYDDEVMTLCYSRNPRNLQGVSPASAVRFYAIIDDLLAQFEKAYLENGAIPASVTIIRASTQAKFKETQADLERQLKGASNRNKTIYLWRQFNNDDGTERDQVEVKPIQGNNNTLAIRELVDVINDRLNKAYGVSNFILGDDSSAKYDNAELSDYQFTRRRVKPALRKFWSEFQHELDRITGGLGYGIVFQLDEPELTERRKVEAETAEKNVNNLHKLIASGSKPVAACIALNLPTKKWAPVATGIYNRVLADREQNIQSTPEASLAVAPGGPAPEPVKDLHQQRGVCQHHHEHSEDYYKPFTQDETTEKAIFERLMSLARAIFAEKKDIDLEGIQDEIFDLLEEEANRGGTEALEAIGRLADEDIEAAIKEMLEKGVSISEALQNRIRERTAELVKGFDQHSRELLRATLESSEGLTREQIEQRLADIMPAGRAATIARNEVVYAFKSGRLEMDESIAEQYHLTIDLIWRTSPEAGPVCPACAAMDGQITRLGKAFTPQPYVIEKKDGTEIEFSGYEQSQWNDYGRIPNAHVNCKCYFDEKLVRTA